MNRFEHDLRESLKRREPPADFADKVLARTRVSESRTKPGHWHWRAAAAMVVVMIGGGFMIQEQRREARRQASEEQKKEELLVALRITGSKLRLVQERLSAIQQRTIELQVEQ